MEMDHLCCAGAPQELDVGRLLAPGEAWLAEPMTMAFHALEIEVHIPLLSGDLPML
jgi:hypothetical protein